MVLLHERPRATVITCLWPMLSTFQDAEIFHLCRKSMKQGHLILNCRSPPPSHLLPLRNKYHHTLLPRVGVRQPGLVARSRSSSKALHHPAAGCGAERWLPLSRSHSVVALAGPGPRLGSEDLTGWSFVVESSWSMILFGWL